jgi:hypothetical protein
MLIKIMLFNIIIHKILLLPLLLASKPLRYQNAKFLTCIGLVAGLTYATLSSSQRFMGLEPNDSEVRRYGSLTKEQVDEYNKISGSIGAELIGKHKLSK